jgi:glycosyltransferase involved in cell wall biosynthesis
MMTNAVMPDQLGGLQRYVAALAGAVAREGWQVTILAKRVSPDLAEDEVTSDGVHIRRYQLPDRSHPAYVLGYPLSTFRAVAESQRTAGLIHVHYPLQGIVPAVTRRHFVHTFHAPVYRELLPEHQGRYALAPALRRPLVNAMRIGEGVVARRACATVVLSDFMREELRQLAPKAADRAVKLPAGLDTRLFSPGPRAISLEGRPLLLTARRLVPRNGVEELVRAMPEVLARHPAAQLAIVGDGPLREQIARAVTELGCAQHVHLLGRVSDTQLRDWYRAADLFVLPTQELEGFGMATTEALACGTPALGTPIGATPEILRRIDTRLVARGCAHDDLSRSIIELTSEPGLLDALASSARADAVARTSWSSIARRHIEIYERSFVGP